MKLPTILKFILRGIFQLRRNSRSTITVDNSFLLVLSRLKQALELLVIFSVVVVIAATTVVHFKKKSTKLLSTLML